MLAEELNVARSTVSSWIYRKQIIFCTIQSAKKRRYLVDRHEPAGYVSYGRYDENEVYRFVGIGPREWKNDYCLPFNCPFS
jgi:hypothetical protein